MPITSLRRRTITCASRASLGEVSGVPTVSVNVAVLSEFRVPGWCGSTALHHAELVAGGIAEAGVDAVGLLGRLLRELDAARRELVVAGAAVLGGEEEAARRALGEQVEDLAARLVVEDRCAGDGHQDDRDVLARHADSEPA